MDHPAQPTSTRLDPWVGTYAARTRGLTASEIRALFAVADRPEVVSLAGGMPFSPPSRSTSSPSGRARRPRPGRSRAAVRVGPGRRPAARADPRRHGAVGVDGAPRRRRRDHRVAAGARPRHAHLHRPGRRRRRRGAHLRRRPRRVLVLPGRRRPRADRRGRAASRRPARGDRVRRGPRAGGSSSSTSMPNFHNPAGVTHGPARRPEVLEIARSVRRPACSRTTRTACSASTATVPRAIRADDSEGVVYLGSFSKTFAAGLRVGWAVAPHAVREKLVLANETATLCPSNLTQLSDLGLPRDQPWRDQIKVVPRALPRAARRSARVARRALCRRARVDRARTAASTAG